MPLAVGVLGFIASVLKLQVPNGADVMVVCCVQPSGGMSASCWRCDESAKALLLAQEVIVV